MSNNCISCLGANCLDQPAMGVNLYSLSENPILFAPDYTIIPGCPPGYRCNHPSPPTHPRVPPIIPTNGQLRINCCMTPLFATIPPGATAGQIAAIAANLQLACAEQQAICDYINSPTSPPVPNPPQTGPPGRGQNPQHVCNTQQCATATCMDPTKSITRCTDAGTFCVDVSDGSAASLNEAQGIVDGQARQDAQARANHDAMAGGCNYCNDAQSGQYICPGDATKVSFVTIPACTYTSDNPDDVPTMNARANADLVNALTTAQIGLGCACPGVTIDAHSPDGTLTNPNPAGCCIQYYWNKNSPLYIYLGQAPCPGVATFNAAAQFLMFNGSVLHGTSILTPVGFNGPTITQVFP